MNNDSKIKTLTDEILTLTMEIKDKYPEVYETLGETPLSITRDNAEINSEDLERYRDTLKDQLENLNDSV